MEITLGEWFIFAAILILSLTISNKNVRFPDMGSNILSLEKTIQRLLTGKRKNGESVNLVEAILEVANAVNNYTFYISTTGRKERQ